MKTVIWEVPARQEYNDALAVSQKADEFQLAVNDSLDSIANGIVSHAQVPRTRCRECILTGYPYSIIYIETDAEVRVIAFPHHKRKTGYWKSRLPKN